MSVAFRHRTHKCAITGPPPCPTKPVALTRWQQATTHNETAATAAVQNSKSSCQPRDGADTEGSQPFFGLTEKENSF